MRVITKRTAAFTAAIAGFALIGSGCSHATKSAETTSSATAPAASSVGVPGTMGSAPSSPTQMTSANGTSYEVGGPILAKYLSLDETARKSLGAPTGGEQKNQDGGVYQQFDGGVIIHKVQSYVVWGAIRVKWNELGGSQGKLGYPTSDEVDATDGVKTVAFEHGTVMWKPGEEATVTFHTGQ